jgi:hypothetical protein
VVQHAVGNVCHSRLKCHLKSHPDMSTNLSLKKYNHRFCPCVQWGCKHVMHPSTLWTDASIQVLDLTSNDFVCLCLRQPDGDIGCRSASRRGSSPPKIPRDGNAVCGKAPGKPDNTPSSHPVFPRMHEARPATSPAGTSQPAAAYVPPAFIQSTSTVLRISCHDQGSM